MKGTCPVCGSDNISAACLFKSFECLPDVEVGDYVTYDEDSSLIEGGVLWVNCNDCYVDDPDGLEPVEGPPAFFNVPGYSWNGEVGVGKLLFSVVLKELHIEGVMTLKESPLRSKLKPYVLYTLEKQIVEAKDTEDLAEALARDIWFIRKLAEKKFKELGG